MARNTTTKQAADDAASIAASPVPLLRVTCLIAAGRRRAGRRWSGGDTDVPADALTAEEWAEVEADPMFSTQPLAVEG
ncbi:hypothetical protein [Paracoccus sp. (in: a-proteobacteria)]|uniref:hypothetical protein n=1 Tax=Paracoccus sp. TaxID=267 RepID=UPI0026E05E74|nr:hypothetical protein [Paracoccus sp. (in: a-proteobacteria)]MDO5648859.1 hypothetical protein [Paracoccus sp. (in: a-proteobacteria)]